MATVKTQGATLKVGDAASPEVFTAIGEVIGFDGPGGSAAVIDITDLSATAKEKSMGLPDEGQITAELNYDPANTQQDALWTARANQTLKNFQITIPSSPVETWSFAGYVTGFSHAVSLDDVVKASVTIEISGAVTKA